MDKYRKSFVSNLFGIYLVVIVVVVITGHKKDHLFIRVSSLILSLARTRKDAPVNESHLCGPGPSICCSMNLLLHKPPLRWGSLGKDGCLN